MVEKESGKDQKMMLSLAKVEVKLRNWGGPRYVSGGLLHGRRSDEADAHDHKGPVKAAQTPLAPVGVQETRVLARYRSP